MSFYEILWKPLIIPKNINFFSVNQNYYYIAVYRYLVKLNSLRNVHKTSKLYKKTRGEWLRYWSFRGEWRRKNPCSTVIPLLPKTLTPSIEPNFGQPRTQPPLTFAINTLLATQYSSVLFTCPNHLNNLWSTLLASSIYIPALLYALILTKSIRYTPTKLLKHFITRTFTILLSALLILHACAPYNVKLFLHLDRHFFAFIYNRLLLSTFLNAANFVYPSFILCATTFHILNPWNLATPGSKNNPLPLMVSPFTSTPIRTTFTYLEHVIPLLLPTFTLNVRMIYPTSL